MGKSTLFNRLVGRRVALVDDTPGVTRDRREGEATLGDLSFRLIDTAGLEDADKASLTGRMQAQTEAAVREADGVLFVIDARAGVTEADRHFALWLRRCNRPVAVVANKCESRAAMDGVLEAHALGYGQPVPISAEHNEGLSDLYDAVAGLLQGAEATAAEEHDEFADAFEDEDTDDPSRPLRIAVIGRPNVGKSTLINRLLGEDRLLTGPEAGITRDAIRVEHVLGDRPVQLIDTAGMRRRANVTAKLERMSVADTLQAVRFCEVACVMVDATQMFERQDLAIAQMVVNQGRAIVIVVNKWDLVPDRNAAVRAMHEAVEESLPQVRGVRLVRLSAETGRGLDKLWPAISGAYEVWNRRIETSRLNRWLAEATQHHPPPAPRGRRLQLRYITQVKARPPTFALWVNRPEELPTSYLRYLVNDLRERFDMPGTPIRLLTRRGKNPYAKRK